MNKSNIKRYGLLLIIFGILSILFIFPLFKWHFLPFGDDMDFNVDRIVGLKDNLMHLNLFPQICTYTFHNCAYPLYIFYPWITLIPFAIFQIIIPNHMWGIAIAFVFYAFIGLTIAYKAVKNITKNETQAFFTAVCYIFSEYLSIDAFRRFDLGEFLGMIFMPIVFYGFYTILFQENKNWAALGLGMSLVTLSHILTTFIISFTLLILFIVGFHKIDDKVSALKSIVKAMILWLGASAIFLFPFLEQVLTQKFSSQKGMISQYFIQDFGTLVMSSLNSNCYKFRYGIGIWGILIMILGLIYYRHLSSLGKTSYLIGSFTFFMTSATFPWYLFDNTFVSIIQFSYRLLLLTTLFYAYVGGELIFKWFNYCKRNDSSSPLALFICALVFLIVPQIGQTQLILQNTDTYRQGMGRLSANTGQYDSWTSFDLEMYTPIKNQEACPNAYNNIAKIKNKNLKLAKDDMKIQPNSITYSSPKVNGAHKVFLPVIYNKVIYSVSRNGKKVKIIRARNGQLGINSASLGPIKISYQYNWESIIGILSSIICWGLGVYLIFNRKRKIKRV